MNALIRCLNWRTADLVEMTVRLLMPVQAQSLVSADSKFPDCYNQNYRLTWPSSQVCTAQQPVKQGFSAKAQEEGR